MIEQWRCYRLVDFRPRKVPSVIGEVAQSSELINNKLRTRMDVRLVGRFIRVWVR